MPAAKKPPAEVDPAFAPIVAAFARDRRVTSGKMMASLGLKVDGKIFAMHVRGDLVVKLPKARVDALVADGTGRPFDPRRDGRVMKEWVCLASGHGDWLAIAREARRFVGG